MSSINDNTRELMVTDILKKYSDVKFLDQRRKRSDSEYTGFTTESLITILHATLNWDTMNKEKRNDFIKKLDNMSKSTA